MPTENRPSNTEQMVSNLLPCPFCGQKLELSNRKYNHWARCATHGCKSGQLPLLNTELAADIASWNTRAQCQGDPVGLPDRMPSCKVKAAGWNECLTVIARLGPLYRHPPTSDGFSAGDMADQGAKAFRDGQRALVLPKRMNEQDAVEKLLGRFGVYGRVPADIATDIYNAALDEVRSLNAAAITPE